MTKKEFIGVISYFLQDPEAIVSERGRIVFANGDADYSVLLSIKDGEIASVVDKDGKSYQPRDWIARRLAHVDRLAESILRQYQHDIDEMKYVPVSATFEDSTVEETVNVEDTELFLLEKIQNRDQCQTSVFFITSEAGDGKTILMRRLAVKSAQAFLDGKQDWLYVPIELGGKPFLRLDEFILGSLSRTYRAPFFIDAFIELVKWGRIVLALDGFEESAVQGADGEIISSLGAVLASLDSQGTVVFASRKAFYFHSHLHDYKSFAGLAKSYDVSIAELNLKPWGQHQVIGLCELCGLESGKAKQLSCQLFQMLGANSPLLSRAVLAHKFICEMFGGKEGVPSLESVVNRFHAKDDALLLHAFIAYLLERETRKLVKSDVDVTPILSASEHECILQMIAEEMWKTDTDVLGQGNLSAVVELAIEQLHLTPNEFNRCRSHFPHHAMLKRLYAQSVGFCHIEFLQYFLGAAIARLLLDWDESTFDVLKVLDRKPLPVLALKECARRIVETGRQGDMIPKLRGLVGPRHGETPLGQNVTALLLMLHSDSDQQMEIVGMYCPEFVLRTCYLTNVTLKDCVIEYCDLSLIANSNIRLDNCEFPRAKYIENPSLVGVSFDEHSIPRVVVRSENGDRADIGDMDTIKTILDRAGVTFIGLSHVTTKEEFEDDEKSAVFFKVVGLFDTRTFLTENVLRSRLGTRFSMFEADICSQMIKCGVLEEKDYRGRRDQRLFRLSASGSRLARARAISQGNFDALIANLEAEVM